MGTLLLWPQCPLSHADWRALCWLCCRRPLGRPLSRCSPPPGVALQDSSSASRGTGASLCSARSSAWRPPGGTGGGHFFGLGWISLLLQEGKTMKAINPKLRNSLTCSSMERGWKSKSHTQISGIIRYEFTKTGQEPGFKKEQKIHLTKPGPTSPVHCSIPDIYTCQANNACW